MNIRVIFSSLTIFLGILNIECRRCVTSSRLENGKCPVSKPKCCGSRLNGRHNRCATSCVHFTCHTNFDCDGLTCCSGNCSKSKNCLPVTTWGVVGIAVVCLFAFLASFRACQWCHKRKARARESTRTTNEEPANNEPANNEPPFVVSNFENYGFIAPMAPPAYESVVRNTGPRTDGDPPLYNLNLQTIINNSSANNSGSNNFEVNISIRGSAMFTNDFPPSYSEISDSGDDNGEPVSYNSSQEGVEDLETATLTHSYSDEPPPYSLNEESTAEESPDITRDELASLSTTGPDNSRTNPWPNTDEDSNLGEDTTSEEVCTISNSIPEVDT